LIMHLREACWLWSAWFNVTYKNAMPAMENEEEH
jgi:hypothetical protein